MIALILIAAVLGLLPAAVAGGKGHSFAMWWVYGLFLFPVAMIHALFAEPASAEAARLAQYRARIAAAQSRICPFCAESIKREAKVCRYCGRDVEPVVATPAA